jgi:hypothetical protein
VEVGSKKTQARKHVALPAGSSWQALFSEAWFVDLVQAETEFQFTFGKQTFFVVRRRTGFLDRQEILYSELLLLWFAHTQGFVLERFRTAEEVQRERQEQEKIKGRPAFELTVSEELEERLKRLDSSTGVPRDELEKRLRELDEHGMPGGLK